MAIKYQATMWAKLNADGQHGAILFVASPALQYLTWIWLDPGAFKTVIIMLEGMAFLLGFVLLLIGRTYTTQVEE